MSIKLIVMVKRKPGLTPEQFRDGYENGHARLAVRLFGHLWSEYRRSYLGAATNFVEATGAGDVQGGIPSLGYDAISELVFPDAAALAEMTRLALEHQEEIRQDEERWFDRAHCWMVVSETIEEDLSLSRRTPA